MIKYNVVGSPHNICGEKCPSELGSAARKFWTSRCLGSCDYAVIAKDGDDVVGFFRFDMMGGTIYAFGTYVLNSYRKLGVGKKLWNRAIKNKNPHSIEVYLTSPAAGKLVDSLEKSHRSVDFCVFRN